MKKFSKILILFMIALTMVSGCGPKDDGNTPGQSPTPQATATATPGTSQAESEKFTADLYFSNTDATQMLVEKREFTSNSKLNPKEKAKLAVEGLIKGSEHSDEMTTSIPKTAKVLSVEIENKTAVVDLSKEFVSDNVGGSAGETMAIAPIVLTLTSMEGIEEVMFKIEGKVQPDFKGHYTLDNPFKRGEFEQLLKQ